MWVDLLKQYLAPAGIGALVGAVATVSTTLPKLFDNTDKIRQQRAILQELEEDYAAYSKVMQRFYPRLNSEQLNSLFPKNARQLAVARTDLLGTGWTSSALKQSEEGAYFVWCVAKTTAGATAGMWLTRPEAKRWAVEYPSVSGFLNAFPDEDPRTVDRKTTVAICPIGSN
jgi:hypothetical protein